MLLIALLLQAATAATPASTAPVSAQPQTQTQPSPAPRAIAPPEAMAAPERQSDDIVVTGLRDLDDPGSAVTHATLGSSRTGAGAVVSREVFGLSQRFAHCALSSAPSGAVLSLLRDTIDGNINSSRQRGSQGSFVQRKSTCAQDPDIAQSTGIATVSSDFDMAYYDRGALVIEALHRFAPDIALTTRDTNDRAVQRRFNAREIPRSKFRLPVDRFYFEVAVCLVRMQPDLSVRLALTRGSADTVDRLEAAIVNRGLVCVGNAKKVYFDPSQFRFYIADAVYRWAVAVRGVDSLLPALAKP